MKCRLLIVFLFYTITVGAQFDSLSWQGLDRTYLVHLPLEYIESIETPLLIAMHGGFGNAINIENQSQLSVKADEENFIVVYPEGVKGGVFDIRAWNAGWCCGHASTTNIDDVGFIDALLDKLIIQYSIDPNRTYATGISNGGFMSYRLACELSERIAAIAPVAASMSMVNCNPIRPVPVIDFHSYLDTNVPHQGGYGSGPSTHYNPPLDSILNVWSEINLCKDLNDTIINNTQVTHINWSNCDCESRVVQYISHDGGHSWPGGESTPIGDPVSNFINANDLMWSFFKNYSLDCLASSTNDLNKSKIAGTVIYPNPATDIINIDLESTLSNLETTMYNIMGDKVLTVSGSNELDISHLMIGSYIMTIKINDGIIVRKVIKTE